MNHNNDEQERMFLHSQSMMKGEHSQSEVIAAVFVYDGIPS